MCWDFSVQGQADEVCAVMNAVNDVSGGKGLGMFYWEGAWITVGDITGKSGSAWTRQYNANKMLWEQYGCGWASSYSAAYDATTPDATTAAAPWTTRRSLTQRVRRLRRCMFLRTC